MLGSKGIYFPERYNIKKERINPFKPAVLVPEVHKVFKNKMNISVPPLHSTGHLYPKESLTAAFWAGLPHPVRAQKVHLKQMISAVVFFMS